MRRLKVTGIKLKMYVYPLYLYDMRGEKEKNRPAYFEH